MFGLRMGLLAAGIVAVAIGVGVVGMSMGGGADASDGGEVVGVAEPQGASSDENFGCLVFVTMAEIAGMPVPSSLSCTYVGVEWQCVIGTAVVCTAGDVEAQCTITVEDDDPFASCSDNTGGAHNCIPGISGADDYYQFALQCANTAGGSGLDFGSCAFSITAIFACTTESGTLVCLLQEITPCEMTGGAELLVWGDSDCTLEIGARDLQALLRFVLGQNALSQTEPCPDVGADVGVSP